MAQREMPERVNMPVEYNDIPTTSVTYNTDRGAVTKSGFGKFANDISTGITRDIIKPTIRNLAMQAFDLVANSIKSAINVKLGGGGTSYSSKYQDWTTGYSGNANYNPNRFNVNDGFVHDKPVLAGNTAHMSEPWKNVGFRTMADCEETAMTIKDILRQQGYITVCQFGRCCKQNWDYALDNYGWTELGDLTPRYNIVDTTGLPFEFVYVPDPIYLNLKRR